MKCRPCRLLLSITLRDRDKKAVCIQEKGVGLGEKRGMSNFTNKRTRQAESKGQRVRVRGEGEGEGRGEG